MPSKSPSRKSQRGFSLIELLIVILVLTIISGMIFSSINDALKTSASEQAKMDLYQQSREFLDQMTSDLRNIGYPNSRNFAPPPPGPFIDDAANAVGLVKVDAGELWFEADVNGTGVVSVIRYRLTSDGPNCPCLRRSEIQKTGGIHPWDQPPTTEMIEVQSVANDITAEPIFTAYLPDGTPVPPPINFNTDAALIAQINSIKISLKVKSQRPDLITGEYTSMMLVSSARLNNCSQAYDGKPFSCQ